MSDRATIDAAELPPELRARFGLEAPPARKGARGAKARKLSADNVRTLAFRVCAVLAELTPAERARVLRQASKLNDV